MSNYDYNQLKVPADYGDHRGIPLGRPLTASEFDANLKSIIDHGDLEHVHQDDTGQVTIDVGSLSSPIILTMAEAKKGIIMFTGHLTENKEIRFPPGIRKLIAVFNATSHETPFPPELLTVAAGDGTGSTVEVVSSPNNLILLAVDSANNNVRSWGVESMSKIYRKEYTTSGTFDPAVEAPGFENFRLTLVGAGGGGGSGGGSAFGSGANTLGTGGGSGAPGAIASFIAKLKLGAVPVIIGAGGAGAPATVGYANGTAGNTGGTSGLGTFFVSGGGGGGGGQQALVNTARAGGGGGLVSVIDTSFVMASAVKTLLLQPGVAGAGTSANGGMATPGAGGSALLPAQPVDTRIGQTGRVLHLFKGGKHGDGGTAPERLTSENGGPGGSASGGYGGAGGGGAGASATSGGTTSGGAGGSGTGGYVLIEWGTPFESADFAAL